MLLPFLGDDDGSGGESYAIKGQSSSLPSIDMTSPTKTKMIDGFPPAKNLLRVLSAMHGGS